MSSDKKTYKYKRICLIGIFALVVVSIVIIAFFIIRTNYKERYLQKEWIYENLPPQIWNNQKYNVVNEEFKSLNKELSDYANKSIRNYEKEFEQKSTDALLGLSFLGLGDLYLLGESSREKKKDEIIAAYIRHFHSQIDSLSQSITEILTVYNWLYSYKDSLVMPLNETTFYNSSRKEIFDSLIGDINICDSLKHSKYDIYTISTIADEVIRKALKSIKKPEIYNCSYDKKKKGWKVLLDNAPEYFVSFVKRDDGDYNITYYNFEDNIEKTDKLEVNKNKH